MNSEICIRHIFRNFINKNILNNHHSIFPFYNKKKKKPILLLSYSHTILVWFQVQLTLFFLFPRFYLEFTVYFYVSLVLSSLVSLPPSLTKNKSKKFKVLTRSVLSAQQGSTLPAQILVLQDSLFVHLSVGDDTCLAFVLQICWHCLINNRKYPQSLDGGPMF